MAARNPSTLRHPLVRRARDGSDQPALTIDAGLSATLHGDVTFAEELRVGAITAASRPLRMRRDSPDLDAGAAFENTGTTPVHLHFGSNRASANQPLARLYGQWDGNIVAQIAFVSGSVVGNKDRGEVAFYTSPSGPATYECGRFGDEGGLYFRAVSGNPGVDEGYAAIFSKLVDGEAHVFAQDQEDVTPVSSLSHVEGEWVFRSENVRTGRAVTIHVERFVRRVEELSGKTLITKSDAA